MQAVGLIGKKCGMTRIFTDAGEAIPVTVIQFLPNRIIQIKTLEKEGYTALQIATGKRKLAGKRKSSGVSKALIGHYKKSGGSDEVGRVLKEFRIDPQYIQNFNVGDELSLKSFYEGQLLDVTAISRGKGFAGTLKRHNFGGGDATHGASLSHRAPGSIGQRQTPGRVFKGKKMAGHMGNVQRTIQNQKLVRIDVERNLFLIKGAVPGAPGGMVIIKPAVKAKAPAQTGKEG